MAVKEVIARDMANFSCFISSSCMHQMCTHFNSDVSQSMLPLGKRKAERLVRKRKQLLKKKWGEKAAGNKVEWKTNRVNVKYRTEMRRGKIKRKNRQCICRVWAICLQKVRDLWHANIRKQVLLVANRYVSCSPIAWGRVCVREPSECLLTPPLLSFIWDLPLGQCSQSFHLFLWLSVVVGVVWSLIWLISCLV